MLAGVAAASLVVGLSAASFAQQPPAGPPPGGPDQFREHMHERVDARAKALHEVLDLRPDQEAAFQAFQAALAPPPEAAGAPRERPDHDMAALTTPERLDRMADRMARRQDDFQRKAAAIKQFYTVLGPGQQRAFDALLDLKAIEGPGRRGPGEGPGWRGHG
jgi:Spy/CpxP family protein refolding chaperone